MRKTSKGKIEEYTQKENEGVNKVAAAQDVDEVQAPEPVIPNIKDVLFVAPFETDIDVDLSDEDDDSIIAKEC